MSARRLLWIPLLALLAGILVWLARRPETLPSAPPRAAVPVAPPATPKTAAGPAAPESGSESDEPERGSIRVRVFADGLPLKGAEVTVVREGRGSFLRFTTEASGSRQILQMPPGPYAVGAKHPDYLGSETRAWITSGAETEARLDLQAGGRMTGIVTDLGGTPLPDTLVILVDAKSKFTITNALSTRTGPDGRYRMPSIPRGTYGVRFRNERFKVKDRYEFAYLQGTEAYVVDAQLEVGVMAGGRVIDDAGAPLAGVEVQVTGKESVSFVTSDAQGRWEGHGLNEGPLGVTARKAGYGTVVVRNVAADTADLVVRMDRAARLAGRVEADPPPDSFMISLARFEPDLNRSIRVDTKLFENRPDGTFEFEDLAPGTYDLHFEAEGWEPLDRPRVMLSAGGATADTKIRLKRK